MRARLSARASRTKSGAVNWARRRSRRAVMKKYRSERNGRRSFDTAVEYPSVEPTATEKTRTAKSGGPRCLPDSLCEAQTS